MATITSDTLQFSKRLREPGMTDPLAEIFAEVQKEAFSRAVVMFATKKDLTALIPFLGKR